MYTETFKKREGFHWIRKNQMFHYLYLIAPEHLLFWSVTKKNPLNFSITLKIQKKKPSTTVKNIWVLFNSRQFLKACIIKFALNCAKYKRDRVRTRIPTLELVVVRQNGIPDVTELYKVILVFMVVPYVKAKNW